MRVLQRAWRTLLTLSVLGACALSSGARAVEVSISPDGRHVAVVDVSPDGRWLAVAHAGAPRRLSVWDQHTSAVAVREIPPGQHASLAWAPDASQLVVAVDTSLWLLRPDDVSAPPVSIPLGADARGVEVSPDGTRIAVGHLAGVTLVDPVRVEVQTVTTPATHVAVAFSPDARRLYVAGTDQITAWDLEASRTIWQHSHRERAPRYRPVDMGGPGPLVFAGGGEELHLDADSGQVVGPGPDSGISSGGRLPWLLVPRRIHPVESRRSELVMPSNARPPLDLTEEQRWGATAVQLHGPDGVFVLPIPDDLWAAALSPDHRRMITLTAGGSVQSWDTRTGELRFGGALFDLGDRPVGAVVWTAGGRWDGDPATVGHALAFSRHGERVPPDAEDVASRRTPGLLGRRR